MDHDLFAENAQNFSKIYHEVFLLMKFLPTKPQVKIMKIKYHDIYYTVIENRDEKINADNQYENNFINFNDIVIHSHKPRAAKLK